MSEPGRAGADESITLHGAASQRGKSEDADIRLRPVRHPLRAVVFLGVVGVLIASAFAVGTLVRSPADDVVGAGDARVAVTVEAENRVVADAYALPAQILPGDVAEIRVTEASTPASEASSVAEPADGHDPSPSGDRSATLRSAERVVVSATMVGPGDALLPGQLVAEISGRPLFVIPGNVPLYRDIAPGDVGRDVEGLQQLLLELGHGGGKPGTFDEGTQAALARLYRDAGYSVPLIADGVRGVAMREFVALPAGARTVVSVAGVGQTLGADNALLRVQTSMARLSARITVLQRDRFSVGARIGVSVRGGPPVAASILELGPFGSDASSGGAGHPIVVSMPDGEPVDDAAQVMLVPLETPPPGLAIPTIALRQEGGKAFVLVAPGQPSASQSLESSNPPERVEVTARAQADGWTAIEADGRIVPGTRVLVE